MIRCGLDGQEFYDDLIELDGYYGPGDGGAAKYKKVATEPDHAGKVCNHLGEWWELRAQKPNILMFGAKSGSAADSSTNVVAFNEALKYRSKKGGGIVRGAAGVFYVNRNISHDNENVTFDGIARSTVIKATLDFEDHQVFQIKGKRNIVKSASIDCSSLVGSRWVSGVIAYGNTRGSGVVDCSIENASFCGIITDDGAGAFKHDRFFAKRNDVCNVGWVAISFGGTVNGRIVSNDVSRTGFTCIWAENRNVGLRIRDNDVSKAMPPYRVYDGPGSFGGVEHGFLIGYAPSNKFTLIADNRCNDNRNAGYDGIGLGEDGTEHGPCTIRNNVVQYAGLFGIDVASQSKVIGNTIIESAGSGIFMSLDLGGVIYQSIVKSNTILNCNNAYGIQISQNMGKQLTIADCEISGNIVRDDRQVQIIEYGIRIYRKNLTIRSLKISGNTAVSVKIGGFLNDGEGPDWPIVIDGNCWKDRIKPVAGTFSTTGYEAFNLFNNPGGGLRLFTGGYEGKEISVYFSDGNTTIYPDWADIAGHDINRIIGLGNVQKTMPAGSLAKFRYRQGVGWHVTSLSLAA